MALKLKISPSSSATIAKPIAKPSRDILFGTGFTKQIAKKTTTFSKNNLQSSLDSEVAKTRIDIEQAKSSPSSF